MTVSEVRKRYLDFFAKRGHVVIPSAPIVPENDPTTLFTSSGMQPLVPYLLGKDHPEGKRLVNSQMSFRAEDIEEVGDNRHTTFFEMLGNWSLGDYFKREQLPWIFEFLTSKEEGLGFDPQKLYVTVFDGDPDTGIGLDTEAVEIWQKLFKEKGIDAKLVRIGTEKAGYEKGMQGGRIFSYSAKNWWSRAGVPGKMPAGEPGGPDSEIFYDFGTEHDSKYGRNCHVNCDCGRFIEIANSVFMQFVKQADGSFKELPKKNVDFGGGLERLTATCLHTSDVFDIDVFTDARKLLEQRSGTKYGHKTDADKIIDNFKLYILPIIFWFLPNLADSPEEKDAEYGQARKDTRAFRIILDHMRAATFMLASGIAPGNSEQPYVLRRLIRRAIREVDRLGIKDPVLVEIAETYAKAYAGHYSFIKEKLPKVREELQKEEERFRKTLTQGLRELEKMGKNVDAFTLFTTYGFPVELTAEIAKERGTTLDLEAVQKKMESHRAESRAGAAQKFAGGLADHSAQTVRYHTAHHLLLKALQMVLGKEVHQRGSNITSERLRIDFSHGAKITPEQLSAVEAIVNEKIGQELPVIRTVMPRSEAEKLGAEREFGQTYPENVSVYSVGPKGATEENPQIPQAFSLEFCGGPHVGNTREIGEGGKKFKIVKEEASSAGVRRIKAVLQ